LNAVLDKPINEAQPVQTGSGQTRRGSAERLAPVVKDGNCAVALLGTFDVSNFGDLLFPAIFRHEMAARGISDVASFSPLGERFFSDRADRCLAISSLRRSPSIRLLVLGGGHLLHPDHGGLMRVYAALHRRVRLKLLLIGTLGRLERHAGLPANLRTSKRKWELVFGYRCPIPLLPAAAHTPRGSGLIINACGAYGLPGRLGGRELDELRMSLNRTLYLSVRDNGSAECLKALQLNKEIIVVPDMALLVPEIFGTGPNHARPVSPECQEFQQRGDYLIVQGGIDAEHAAAIGDTLLSISTARNLRVILLPIRSWARDLESLKHLAKFGQSRFQLVDRYLKPPEIAALIANSRCVVTNGLHSLVTAVAFDRPVLPLPNRDEKISGFLQMLSLGSLQSRSWTEVPRDLQNVLKIDPDLIHRAAERGRATLRTHFDHIAELCCRTLASHPA
jgi:hypothetical protein